MIWIIEGFYDLD